MPSLPFFFAPAAAGAAAGAAAEEEEVERGRMYSHASVRYLVRVRVRG